MKAKTKQGIKKTEEMRCPMYRLVDLLSGTWTTYILWLLHVHGPLRFGQLKKHMPTISAKVLTERLRMLEAAGVVTRKQEATIPPKVTYSFSKRGKELNRLLNEINRLAKKWETTPRA